MSNSRMTVSQQDAIVARIVADKFIEMSDKFKEEKQEFAWKLYNKIYSKSDQKAMGELKRGWLPTTDSLDFRLGDYGWHRFPLVDEKGKGAKVKVPYEHLGSITVSPKDKDLYNMIVDFVNKEEDLKKKKSDMRSKAEAIVKSTKSSKRLVTIWPEIEPIVMDICNIIISNVPAERMTEMNEFFNLPPEEKAA